MTLIKSISGIRGTIGGKIGEGLNPLDIVKFTSAYAAWLKNVTEKDDKYKVVVGRDARISGEMVQQIVCGSLLGMGINVIDIGLATTPTVEIAVTEFDADGGIILTASHNPRQWNALKLLNSKGEFLSDQDGKEILNLADKSDFTYTMVDEIGKMSYIEDFEDRHIEMILDLPFVDVDAIKSAGFVVSIDCVNSVGGKVIPKLLDALGVTKIRELYTTPNGNFPHNPEPLPEHLEDIRELIKAEGADVGFVVDPDVDRLAIINEDGTLFGEEYTLVAVADYILQSKPGNTVSNLSSTRALRDITEEKGGYYFAAAVGEVNVVESMKKNNAVIGGEGNGGVILPDLHYGRDALVGIALFLSYLAKEKVKCSELRGKYPNYVISKNKISLTPGIDVDEILQKVKQKYTGHPVNDIDGVKIEFDKAWVHLRKSNTEPIIRVYAESTSAENANKLAENMITEIKSLIV
jgi:phosphomannomutase